MGCFDIHPALRSLENLLLAIGEERKKEKACTSYYGCELSSPRAQLFQGLKETLPLFWPALFPSGAELVFLG